MIDGIRMHSGVGDDGVEYLVRTYIENGAEVAVTVVHRQADTGEAWSPEVGLPSVELAPTVQEPPC